MKTFLRVKIFVVLGILSFTVPLLAAGGPPPPTFLPADALNPLTAIKPPPAHYGRGEHRDFAVMLKLQRERGQTDCDRAAAVAKGYNLSSLFGPPYGPLSSEEATNLESFFDKVQGDINFFNYGVKNHWKRQRPYAENDIVKAEFSGQEIDPCFNVTKEKSPSYPSGHTAVSRVFARLLGDLDPSRRDAFMARADQVASDRVMSGLHHPSDIKAGKKLGDEIYKLLKKNKNFEQQLRAY